MTLQTAREGMNIAQAAKYVGVHYQTMRNWIAAGKVPCTVFGQAAAGRRRIVRIAQADLEPLRAGEGLTIPQAAERVGVHHDTMYKWVREGKVAAVEAGGRRRIDPADLEQLRTRDAGGSGA
jgi:excisionase family DNA binding protein